MSDIENLKYIILEIEETIRILEEQGKEITDLSLDMQIESEKIKLWACEKQIAIEVDCIDINKMAWLDGYCVCGEYVTDSMNYCIKCGQKLDWVEVEK